MLRAASTGLEWWSETPEKVRVEEAIHDVAVMEAIAASAMGVSAPVRVSTPGGTSLNLRSTT